MPIGIMGRTSLALIEVHGVYQQEERSHKHVCAVSLYVAKTPKASIKDLKPHYHDTCRHCRLRFCWKTFLETAAMYRQTDTIRQNTLTNRTIGKLITFCQSSLVDWCH